MLSPIDNLESDFLESRMTLALRVATDHLDDLRQLPKRIVRHSEGVQRTEQTTVRGPRVERFIRRVESSRDYGDVRPLRGIFRGEGDQMLSVSVEVTRLDAGGGGSSNP